MWHYRVALISKIDDEYLGNLNNPVLLIAPLRSPCRSGEMITSVWTEKGGRLESTEKTSSPRRQGGSRLSNSNWPAVGNRSTNSATRPLNEIQFLWGVFVTIQHTTIHNFQMLINIFLMLLSIALLHTGQPHS